KYRPRVQPEGRDVKRLSGFLFGFASRKCGQLPQPPGNEHDNVVNYHGLQAVDYGAFIDSALAN
ncbi:MAG TPA: hypothetical protein VJ508_14215, partial [Saprospiraceae bacterium]|nr:hypothetical protein [Saprospiraceae bacterium]